MRQIKASEVKPGMEVQFDLEGWDVKGTVGTVKVLPHSVWIYTEKCYEMPLDLDTPVTVLSEPALPQPEEPTALGARVIVNGRCFLRAPEGKNDVQPWLESCEGAWYEWAALCDMGPVTVLPDPGWTVPADREPTPEVPERIEEWPEDDEPLWPFRWEDSTGWVWKHHGADDGCWTARKPGGSSTAFNPPNNRPCDGPWTRVTDA